MDTHGQKPENRAGIPKKFEIEMDNDLFPELGSFARETGQKMLRKNVSFAGSFPLFFH